MLQHLLSFCVVVPDSYLVYLEKVKDYPEGSLRQEWTFQTMAAWTKPAISSKEKEEQPESHMNWQAN